MRKHATWYTRGIVHGAILRDLFNKATTREDFLAILEEYFDYHEPKAPPLGELSPIGD